MLIAGLQKNSLVDYRGKVAAVVFVPYCNFNCYYCHNRILLEKTPSNAKYSLIDNKDFFEFLDKRQGLIHGVVITGGEPTLHADLPQFIEKVRKKGFPVKLDTNGYKPDMIEKLIDKNLLDYIAMDVKASAERYEEICGVSVNIETIKKSISLIMDSGIDYEFRTTVTPVFTPGDIEEIAGLIAGAGRYVLQQFKKPGYLEEPVDLRNLQKPLTRGFFETAKEVCQKRIAEVLVRGVDI